MQRKKKAAPVVEAPIRIDPEVLQELIPGPVSAAGVESTFQQLKKAAGTGIERRAEPPPGLSEGRRPGRKSRQPPPRPTAPADVSEAGLNSASIRPLTEYN